MEKYVPTPEEIERELRNWFEAELPGRIERRLGSQVHSPIPLDFFSAASSECRELFVNGNFYGCITLSQSVAEGLAKFIAARSKLSVVEDFGQQINILQGKNVERMISKDAYAAFRRIHGTDRNDFHHLNKEIEQDWRELEKRAKACIEALYAIESEVFAIEWDNGKIIRVQPKYWPEPADNGDMLVFIRS